MKVLVCVAYGSHQSLTYSLMCVWLDFVNTIPLHLQPSTRCSKYHASLLCPADHSLIQVVALDFARGTQPAHAPATACSEEYLRLQESSLNNSVESC